MNVLFLSLGKYRTIREHEVYTDLLREFVRAGDRVYVLSPVERREGKAAERIEEDGAVILKVKTGNIQKTNIIEKGISTLLIESQFLHAIKKHLRGVHFDLILYPTPPITFVKVVQYIKKRDGAKAYLMLKDIFPQNAVDIGMMRTGGVKGILYKYFRKKEKTLYALSDTIGCMSQANADYVLAHNPEIPRKKVEVCPNAIEVQDVSVSAEEKHALREKYGIPQEKTVFVYGGNLGKPQGISFLAEALDACRSTDAYFLIVGDGTEYPVLEKYIESKKPANVKLMRRLPRDDYERMIAACDVGMIFLDHRFTIPNFPSRLLAYMQASLPVLACTDCNTDIGKVIVAGGYGWWCESNDADAFRRTVEYALQNDLPALGAVARAALINNYTAAHAYKIIQNAIGEA